MNQFCSQKGNSDAEFLLVSLYTIRVGPEAVVEVEEGEGFLRDRLCDPDEATIPPD